MATRFAASWPAARPPGPRCFLDTWSPQCGPQTSDAISSCSTKQGKCERMLDYSGTVECLQEALLSARPELDAETGENAQQFRTVPLDGDASLTGGFVSCTSSEREASSSVTQRCATACHTQGFLEHVASELQLLRERVHKQSQFQEQSAVDLAMQFGSVQTSIQNVNSELQDMKMQLQADVRTAVEQVAVQVRQEVQGLAKLVANSVECHRSPPPPPAGLHTSYAETERRKKLEDCTGAHSTPGKQARRACPSPEFSGKVGRSPSHTPGSRSSSSQVSSSKPSPMENMDPQLPGHSRLCNPWVSLESVRIGIVRWHVKAVLKRCSARAASSADAGELLFKSAPFSAAGLRGLRLHFQALCVGGDVDDQVEGRCGLFLECPAGFSVHCRFSIGSHAKEMEHLFSTSDSPHGSSGMWCFPSSILGQEDLRCSVEFLSVHECGSGTRLGPHPSSQICELFGTCSSSVETVPGGQHADIGRRPRTAGSLSSLPALQGSTPATPELHSPNRQRASQRSVSQRGTSLTRSNSEAALSVAANGKSGDRQKHG
mmetsp:Transcript_37490/g.86484  ORF Transcript_37490/g.86484 Transcript_37490/m.86484 type:complete len:546 (-) Transcript_37490:346-1983(-)